MTGSGENTAGGEYTAGGGSGLRVKCGHTCCSGDG